MSAQESIVDGRQVGQYDDFCNMNDINMDQLGSASSI